MSSLRDLLHPTDESPFSSPGSVNTPIPGSSASSTQMTYLTIEYILDTICPHCYIGLRNLEAAITIYRKRHPDVEFEVVCTPFILDPPLYKPGYEKAGIPFQWTQGSPSSRSSHMLLRLALEASPSYVRSTHLAKHHARHSKQPLKLRQADIVRLKTLSPSQIAESASSTKTPTPAAPEADEARTSRHMDVDFHNLVSSSPYRMPSPVMLPQARGPNLQLSLALALCRGYFEHNINICNTSALVDVAVRVLGFSEAEIRSCLQNEEWARLVEILSIEARARIELPGTTASAPAMIFQNQFLHAGWTHTDSLLAIFDDLREGRSPRRASPAAAS
ncbi:DsbA family protein [Microdochium nivale]|nr:DsbA family protein [Microdochium nivale]